MMSVDTTSAYFYCSGMLERLNLLPRLAIVIGYLEAVALAGYGASIALFEQTGTTAGVSGTGADVAPAVLTALYFVFAALTVLVTRLLSSSRRAAFTPFVLIQAFALVVAQSLLGASGTRLAGVVLVAVAGTALAAVFASRRQLS